MIPYTEILRGTKQPSTETLILKHTLVWVRQVHKSTNAAFQCVHCDHIQRRTYSHM